MENKTFAIIAICKGNTKYTAAGIKVEDGIRHFLSDRCLVPINYFRVSDVDKAVKDAFYDFLDTCDRPSTYLREVDNIMSAPIKPTRYTSAVCAVLANVDVMNGATYINGFNNDYGTILREMHADSK